MKISKTKLRQIIKEEFSKVLSEGQGWLRDLVQGEFQAWQKEQEANRNKFQPGLGSGGNEGKAATHRYEVFDKVKRTLIQNHGFMDGLAAYKLKMAGEQYDEEKVIDVGEPIYKEIYTILYDLIPRPRR